MTGNVPYCSSGCAERATKKPTELPIVPLLPVAERRDSGKPELSHVDVFPRAQEGVALNAAYGASKYDLWNFLKGAKNSLESYNCARRHMSKWFNGEDLVPDAVAAGFNVHHIDAAIWNLMRLREELETFPERDNRPPRRQKPSDDKCVNSDWCKKCRDPK